MMGDEGEFGLKASIKAKWEVKPNAAKILSTSPKRLCEEVDHVITSGEIIDDEFEGTHLEKFSTSVLEIANAEHWDAHAVPVAPKEGWEYRLLPPQREGNFFGNLGIFQRSRIKWSIFRKSAI
ncbi:hypothetical protein ANCCAN_00136 [Ancylostoma caninum]|uniref:Uncharacterized protein n=1 Tax=Ancylostoma caninum TaxID=29170 RepID=A0A368HAL0_ANCCA|nr:hypothetical protein ANCCAN_00136 [Ancylostoma caninum]